MLCLCEFLLLYWRTFFTFIFPVVTIPIFYFNDTPAYRCLYVFVYMAALWMTEAIHPAVTSLLPMIFFPMMSIMDSDKVAATYLNDTTMMLIGSIAIAIAFETTGLHVRVALYTIKCIGCSIKKLHIGIAFVTMFISMWIANTAATALMIPIVEGTLRALEGEGLITMWKPLEPGKEEARPTNITQCYYSSIAFCSLVGGTGCILGSASHLAFKGMYETKFPDSPGVEFAKWMLFNVPLMLLCNIMMVLWLQILYLGLFRPNSKAAQELAIGEEAAETTLRLIKDRIEELGPMKFSEKAVAVTFVSSIFMWFFRRPGFMDGWPIYISTKKCGDAVVGMMVLVLFVILPMEPTFLYIRSKDLEKRPTLPSISLMSWKTFSDKMHWGMLFVLGGGFAMAAGAKESGMTELIALFLEDYLYEDRVVNLMICAVTGSIITQFLSSNTACVTILTPIILSVSVKVKLHPMYLGLANALACCYSYFLPVSNPPNALVSGPSRMGAKEFMAAGSGSYVGCLLSLLVVYPFYAPLIWDMDEFPEWAKLK